MFACAADVIVRVEDAVVFTAFPTAEGVPRGRPGADDQGKLVVQPLLYRVDGGAELRSAGPS